MQIANTNPHVTVTGRHLAITAAINDYAHKRVESLHLDYPRIIEAHVILEVDKYRHRAEVVLVCANHITIEASEETSDLYASMDQVVSKVARQMRKYKTRLLRSHRPRRQESVRYLEAKVFEAPAYHEEPVNGAKMGGNGTDGLTPINRLNGKVTDLLHPEPEVMQMEKYPVKPMFVDEAMLQMEVAEQPFLVFLNAKTEKVNVLYRRPKGDFGLIEPVF